VQNVIAGSYNFGFRNNGKIGDRRDEPFLFLIIYPKFAADNHINLLVVRQIETNGARPVCPRFSPPNFQIPQRCGMAQQSHSVPNLSFAIEQHHREAAFPRS
jgi:hypothetical protein